MAAVTICSDFGKLPPQKNVSHYFYYFPIQRHLSKASEGSPEWPRSWMLPLKPSIAQKQQKQYLKGSCEWKLSLSLWLPVWTYDQRQKKMMDLPIGACMEKWDQGTESISWPMELVQTLSGTQKLPQGEEKGNNQIGWGFMTLSKSWRVKYVSMEEKIEFLLYA